MDLRTVHDPVHKFISLPDIAWCVIDTPEFQRLRELKQLGTAYYVFPGASHNRFEHSLGVCHLAGELIQQFEVKQPELEITQYEIESIQLAGLCHDLGHGPFSHVFDSSFIPAVLPQGVEWTHEDGSKMMLEYLIDENSIDISTDQVKFIQSLIDGVPNRSHDRNFLYQIVANKTNSMDVDKYDYLARDCINVGQLSSYDTSRLMKNCRVIDQEICYHVKEKFNIYDLFHTRYSLFKRVYSHKTCTALNLMVTDAFILANPVFKFSEAIYDPTKYLNLTDHILRDIELSSNPTLKDAQDIIKRIKSRELYKFVDEVSVEPSFRQFFRRQLTPSLIASSAVNVRPEDIRVAVINLHHGMLEEDPVQHIGFYTKYDPTHKIYLSGNDTNYLSPKAYCETLIRVYATNAAKVKSIQEAFRKSLEPLLDSCGSASSPTRYNVIPSNYNVTLKSIPHRNGSENRKRRFSFEATTDTSPINLVSKFSYSQQS